MLASGTRHSLGVSMQQGQVIGRYELLRRLGGGAFGEVWLVRHLDLEVERAMKIPTDPDHIRQLRKEGKIQFGLRHPNIVQTVDLDTRSDPPWFVMEYVEGEDLRKRLTRSGKLPTEEAIRVVAQVLRALEAAHAQGVLHRDLKPENILLAADGTVKVTDFGLGKVQAEVARSLILSGSMMTVEGKSISGTYEYMSPEQRTGQDPDPRDDVYAVGILTCELLTGGRPPASGVAKAMKRAGVPEALVSVVDQACDEVAYRYTSASQMRQALEAVAGPAARTSPPPLRAAGAEPPPRAAARVGPPPRRAFEQAGLALHALRRRPGDAPPAVRPGGLRVPGGPRRRRGAAAATAEPARRGAALLGGSARRVMAEERVARAQGRLTSSPSASIGRIGRIGPIGPIAHGEGRAVTLVLFIPLGFARGGMA
jgi:predicted Ser/Thr protein kinase